MEFSFGLCHMSLDYNPEKKSYRVAQENSHIFPIFFHNQKFNSVKLSPCYSNSLQITLPISDCPCVQVCSLCKDLCLLRINLTLLGPGRKFSVPVITFRMKNKLSQGTNKLPPHLTPVVHLTLYFSPTLL